MKPTDHFTFYPVDRNRDQAGAAKALDQFVRGSGREALQKGMFANVEDAKAIYEAVRPYGYAVRGKDMGKVGPALRLRATLIRLAHSTEQGSPERTALLDVIAGGRLRWKKVLDYRSGDKKVWKWEAKSANHSWSLESTGEHPELGSAHYGKRAYVSVYKDGKKFGKPRRSFQKAKDSVQEWVDEYEGTEWDK
jgi:hypothetical protein